MQMDKRRESLQWLLDFASQDLGQLKAGDRAKLEVEAEEYVFPWEELDQIAAALWDKPSRGTGAAERKMLVESLSNKFVILPWKEVDRIREASHHGQLSEVDKVKKEKMDEILKAPKPRSWLQELPERGTGDYWNLIQEAQKIANWTLRDLANPEQGVLRTEKGKRISKARNAGTRWSSQLIVSIIPEKEAFFRLFYIPMKEYSLSYSEFRDLTPNQLKTKWQELEANQKKYNKQDFRDSLTLKIYRLLEGLPSSVIRECPACKKLFLNFSRREKVYCSLTCYRRFYAASKREADREEYNEKMARYQWEKAYPRKVTKETGQQKPKIQRRPRKYEYPGAPAPTAQVRAEAKEGKQKAKGKEPGSGRKETGRFTG